MSEPHLRIDPPVASPRGIALILHGGQEHSHRPVRPWNVAALRMVPFARRIAKVGDGQIVVARLRYLVRGWNGPARSPVADAHWALDRLRDLLGDLPVTLVGHSMGGRTAIYAAGHPSVRSVVGLAPWIESGDPFEQLHGRDVLFVHGTADRMTSHRATASFADRLTRHGVPVTLVQRPGEHHAMLRNADVWHDLAAAFTRRSLLGGPPSAPLDESDDESDDDSDTQGAAS